MVNNTYEYIKRVENDSDFLFLLRKGIISLSVMDKKVYYERYLLELKRKKKSDSILSTAIEFKVSTDTVRRAIYFMEN